MTIVPHLWLLHSITNERNFSTINSVAKEIWAKSMTKLEGILIALLQIDTLYYHWKEFKDKKVSLRCMYCGRQKGMSCLSGHLTVKNSCLYKVYTHCELLHKMNPKKKSKNIYLLRQIWTSNLWITMHHSPPLYQLSYQRILKSIIIVCSLASRKKISQLSAKKAVKQGRLPILAALKSCHNSTKQRRLDALYNFPALVIWASKM